MQNKNQLNFNIKSFLFSKILVFLDILAIREMQIKTTLACKGQNGLDQ